MDTPIKVDQHRLRIAVDAAGSRIGRVPVRDGNRAKRREWLIRRYKWAQRHDQGDQSEASGTNRWWCRG